MPRERMSWTRAFDWAVLNQRLTRLWDMTESSTRVDQKVVTATGTLTLAWPVTTVRATTSGGSVTLTLPPAQTVIGYRVTVKKMTAASTLTLDGNDSETIDGSATLAWTTQYQTYTLESTGTEWIIV